MERQLRRIFVAPPARALEPVRVAGVEPGTRRRRETPVRHLTGERMDERVAIAVLAHEGTSGERSERRLALDKGAQRLDPERPADHRGGLERGLLRRGEQIDAGRKKGMHRVGDDQAGRNLVLDPTVGKHAEELLDEERIALRALDHERPHLPAQMLRCEPVDHAPGVLGRERPQLDGLARLGALAGRSQEEERAPNGRRAVIEELDELGIGPVQILDEDYGRPIGNELVQHACPGSPQALGNSEGMEIGRCGPAESDAEDRPALERAGVLANDLPQGE